jgi:predicted dehydrogenase
LSILSGWARIASTELSRPGRFFERERYGGILTDIASHQIEQFLFFTGAEDAEVAAATVANRANPAHPELQDFGDMLLRTSGIATEGDGRWIEYAGGYTDMLAQREPAGRRPHPRNGSTTRLLASRR